MTILTDKYTLYALTSMYNIDEVYIIHPSDKLSEGITTSKPKGRKPRRFKHCIPYLSVTDSVLSPYPLDHMFYGMLNVFSEEGNNYPYVNLSKVITITNTLDIITTKNIQNLIRCSIKTSERYYNFILLLNHMYSLYLNKQS